MDCSAYREAASARLDGEALGMSDEALDDHLAGCADCASWVDQAVRLNRLARISRAQVPDMADAILDAAPLPRRRGPAGWAVRTLRIALGVIALAQLSISAPSLVGEDMAMPMATHASHESAAFNIALGVGFLAVAMAPGRARAALPIAGTFILVLGVLSIADLADGAVGFGRLATHLAAMAGVLVMLGLARATPRAMDAPPGGRAGRGWSGGQRIGGDDEDGTEDDGRGQLRGVA